MPDTCNHGYWMHDCALCQKQLGECDYGSCTEPSEWYTLDTRDRRGFCPKHMGGLPSYAQPGRLEYDTKRDEYQRSTGRMV